MISAQVLAGRCSLQVEEIQKLREVFLQFPWIEAVYVFGSTARPGRAARDLDLAVLPADSHTGRQKLELLGKLTAVGFDAVDLVFLDEEDFFLRFEAVRPNRILYESEGFDRGSFYSKVVRQYLDFEPYLKRQLEAAKRRLAG